MRTILVNGQVITPSRRIRNGGVAIVDGTIEEIFEDRPAEVSPYDRRIDVGGRYISPGFIDLHVHGGDGCSFNDGNGAEDFHRASDLHMRHGTTSIMPTILISGVDHFRKIAAGYAAAKRSQGNGPDYIGLHLEGPYISPLQKGGFDDEFMRAVNRDEYLQILEDTDLIARWTIAPELEGALELGKELKRRGILASIGHSNAIHEEIEKAFAAGFTHVTHLYSCTSTVSRIHAFRYAGVIESAYLIDGMTVEMIADGKHLPESLLRLIYKIKGPERVCLVTDAMRAAGLPDGRIQVDRRPNGRTVLIEDGVAKLMDRSAFAGSIATTDRLLRTMRTLTGIDLVHLVEMLTLTPAKIIGIDHRKGSLDMGKDADILVFDEDIHIGMVMVAGRIQHDPDGMGSGQG